MPNYVQIPIPKNKLDSHSLIGWEQTTKDIIDALGSQRNATIQVEDDHAMTSEEAAIGTAQKANSSSDCSTI